MSVITLTTDFGVQDWFVGTMKGVILGIQPKATIVDLTHEIAPGAIRAAAFALAAGYNYFPSGTVHLAVVDPGVGSERAVIAVETDKYYFVGPDNGVLSLALARERIKRIIRVEDSQFFLPQVSSTFHGRDIFAPIAAYLSCGVLLEQLGSTLTGVEYLTWNPPIQEPGAATGQVVYIDRFGNAITNLAKQLPIFKELALVQVRLSRKPVAIPMGTYYQSVPEGKPVGVLGSTGYLEIAVNGGHAAQDLGISLNDQVRVESYMGAED